MNTVAASRLDWRAIASGAAATIAIGMSMSFLVQKAVLGGVDVGYGTIIVLSGLVGLFADALGGAIAGLMAKRRGALHGGLAMVLASLFGLVMSVVMLGRYGQIALMGGLAYWVQWLGMAVLGLGVGSLAGLVAARIAAAKSSQ